MGVFKTAIEWTVILVVLAGIAYGIPGLIGWKVWDRYDSSYVYGSTSTATKVGAGVTYTVITLCVLWGLVWSAAGVVWMVHKDASDQLSNHSWRGGGGPETTCKYEQRWVGVVGKGGHEETWTVCR